MPGIDTTQLDLIKPEESYDLETAWDNIESRAIRKLEAKLNLWGVRYFKNYGYKENHVTGQYTDDTVVPAGSDYRGLLFTDSLAAHKNLTMYLQHVHLFSDAAVTASIYIYDASAGVLLDSVSHSFSANTVNRIAILKEYPIWKYPNLFICYSTYNIEYIVHI